MLTPINHALLNGELIPFDLTVSKKAKRMRITIAYGGKLMVTIPKNMGADRMRIFLLSKANWILTKIAYSKSLPERKKEEDIESEYLHFKEEARLLVEKKITKFNALYNFTYKEIRIKNQKTLWGSCSRQGNLNFNYKLALISEQCADYIVVHELCHLREFNHSYRFWNLVAQTIPHHKKIRKELKEKGFSLS